MKLIHVSEGAAKVLRERNITLDLDTAPGTRPSAGETLVTAKEMLENFLRVKGHVHLDAKTETAALRLLNAANRERW